MPNDKPTTAPGPESLDRALLAELARLDTLDRAGIDCDGSLAAAAAVLGLTIPSVYARERNDPRFPRIRKYGKSSRINWRELKEYRRSSPVGPDPALTDSATTDDAHWSKLSKAERAEKRAKKRAERYAQATEAA